jgi:hypothetical protein
MTDIEFTDKDLGLLKRVLSFAVFDVPITDALGNKIYPTPETRAAALELENRMEAAGVPTPGQLFTAYDPSKMVDKIATVRWFGEEGVEYNIRGLVTAVAEDTSDEVATYTVFFADGSEYDFESREALQANSRVELEQE